jgi:hypothetical protein
VEKESINMPIQLINAILQYMGSRPYVEVANLIAGIQKVAEEAAKPEMEQPRD